MLTFILLARAALAVLRVDCLVLVSVTMFQCVCQYSECVYGGGEGGGHILGDREFFCTRR